MRIKKGDTVVVRSGRDKGKAGKVIEVFPKLRKVTVEGINIVKVTKKQSTTQKTGGKFEEPRPLNVSKVGYQHPTKKGLTTRVFYKFDAKGKKKRVAKANNKELN